MSLTPVPPERCGHIAPMALDRTEGGYTARCLRWGLRDRFGKRREKHDERCWSWGGRLGKDSSLVFVLTFAILPSRR